MDVSKAKLGVCIESGRRLASFNSDISCALTNARNVRRYAEAMGILEKTTDRIDSSVIARFAHKNLAPTPLPSQAQQRPKALVTRLRRVTRRPYGSKAAPRWFE
ncbi:hypothetical protein LMTR13_25420 [Bradyrhizobium icense]|uniref:Uncharacterized protein n=1 Tax=Bradyrhizobium icense TaxID=1274631 RepID=A0A1B1UJN5_9BRAD|nr:hypothetical protein LMTR13_25420 [Bradyrhizobium icense]